MKTTTSAKVGGTAALAAVLAAATLAGCSADPAPATSASPSASASAPSASPSPMGPVVREPVWEADLGVELWAAPTAMAGLVLVSGTDGTLTALSENDGTVAWQASTDGELRGPAAVDGEVAYVSADDGSVYAFDGAGTQVWAVAIGDPSARGDYDNYGSQPAVVDGVVYAAGMGGVLAALDQSSGDVLWTFDVGGPVETAIAVADGRVHVTAMNDRHVAVDAATGELLWELNTGGEGTTSPLVMGDAVVVGSRSANVQVRDAAIGDKLWTASYGSSWVQSGGAEVGDGQSFVIGSSDLGVVRGFDIATGDVTMNATVGGWPWGVPAAADGMVYATAIRLDYQQPWESALYAIDAASGDIVWTAAGGDALAWAPGGYGAYGAGAGPLVMGDLVVVAGLDGTVRAYER